MHPNYSFRCPFRVCGLDYPFTLQSACHSAGCLPSSLYTFPYGLGSGLPYPQTWASPNLTGFTQGFPPMQPLTRSTYPGSVRLDLADLVP